MRTGRPRRIVFNHKLRISEQEGQNTRVMALINNLQRLHGEYGESSVTTLIQKLLINMSYADMELEISGRGVGVPLKFGVGSGLQGHGQHTLIGASQQTEVVEEEEEESVADAFRMSE